MTGLRRKRRTVEGREGMVTVYDDRGQYLGCMGQRMWRALVTRPEVDADVLEKVLDLRRVRRVTGSRLAALLDQATPGPEYAIRVIGRRSYITLNRQDADAQLAALAPDMARLLVDMADHLAATRNWVCANMGNPDDMDALLARFAALDEKAGAA